MIRAYPRHTIRLDRDILKIILNRIFRLHTDDTENKVELFEKEFAQYIGVEYAIAVPSGRFGLYAGLMALGLDNDGEIIMPAYSFKGVALAVKAAGFKPVFVDIKYEDCNIDEKLIVDKVTSRTKAILVNHMFGIPANIGIIVEIAKKHGLRVIEDCAHACGAEYEGKKLGSFGDFAFFSFGIGKNLMCFSGGMVTTNDKRLRTALNAMIKRSCSRGHSNLFLKITKILNYYVALSEPIFSLITFPAIFFISIVDINYLDRKLNEDMNLRAFSESVRSVNVFSQLQAEIGIRQLQNLDEYNKINSENAHRFDKLIKRDIRLNVDEGLSENGIRATRFYYVVRSKKRSVTRKMLLRCRIDTKADDMFDCSKIPELGPITEVFPNTRKAILENLEIPSNTNLDRYSVEYISAQVNRFCQ